VGHHDCVGCEEALTEAEIHVWILAAFAESGVRCGYLFVRFSPYETFPVATTFVAVKAFVTNALPWTYKLVVPGTAPIPMFDVAMRVVIFEVPETFTFVVRRFDVTRALVKKALPRTYRLVVPG
jgi:hypothetical protein